MSNIIIKNQAEIEAIRKSCQLAARTIEFIKPFVVPDITTEELDDKINQFILDNGGVSACLNYRHYPKASCISLNEVICHGIPNKQTIIKDGDIVSIDVATILNKYFGDTCYTFKVGNVSDVCDKLVDTTQECLQIGLDQVKPGNRFGKIGYHIANHAHANGYSVVADFAGHGTGVAFHELPHVYHICAENYGPVMKAGMIFTIEPMICEKKHQVRILEDNWTAVTKDGGLCAQFEHTVLVTKTGYEILTQVPNNEHGSESA